MMARRYWTTEEDAIFRTHYPAGGSKAVHALLPHRTLPSIRQYGVRIGVAYKAPRNNILARGWTAQEEAILRQWYGTGVDQCVARLPGRTYIAIMRRAHRLGLRVNEHAYTAERSPKAKLRNADVAMLRANLQRLIGECGSLKAVARRFNTPYSSLWRIANWKCYANVITDAGTWKSRD